MLNHLTSTCLALVLCAAPLAAAPRSPAPPATEVRANVHAAATLTLGMLAATPTAGDAGAENAIFQNVASAGLGEVMGWGQNYWDQVPPAMANQVVTAFQAAFRLLQELFNSEATLDFAALQAAGTKLSAHFTTMRTAVAAPASDAAQRKREVATLAELAVHHLTELPDSPLNPSPAVGITLAVRTAHTASAALQSGLADQPALLAKVRAHLAALAAAAPPAGTAAADLKALVAGLVPHAQAIAAALK